MLISISTVFAQSGNGQTTPKPKAKSGSEKTQKTTETAKIDKSQWPHCCWLDIASEETVTAPAPQSAQENVPADNGAAAASTPAVASGASSGGETVPAEESASEQPANGKNARRKVARKLGKVLIDKLGNKGETASDTSSASSDSSTAPPANSSSTTAPGFIGETEKNAITTNTNSASVVEETTSTPNKHRRQRTAQNQAATTAAPAAEGVVSEAPAAQRQGLRRNQAAGQNAPALRAGNKNAQTPGVASTGAAAPPPRINAARAKVQAMPPAQRAKVVKAVRVRRQAQQ